MSDEYEYGPWIDIPEGGQLQLNEPYRFLHANGYRRFRIATPKPKRELVVGKWYRAPGAEYWRLCIFTEADGGAWLSYGQRSIDARRISPAELDGYIDWSTPPRDEAPE